MCHEVSPSNANEDMVAFEMTACSWRSIVCSGRSCALSSAARLRFTIKQGNRRKRTRSIGSEGWLLGARGGTLPRRDDFLRSQLRAGAGLHEAFDEFLVRVLESQLMRAGFGHGYLHRARGGQGRRLGQRPAPTSALEMPCQWQARAAEENNGAFAVNTRHWFTASSAPSPRLFERLRAPGWRRCSGSSRAAPSARR